MTERRLAEDGRAIALEPKAQDVLVALVRHAGRLLTKRELLDLVWPESFVEDGILTVHISHLRKALGDGARRPAFIETVPRSGYRFVAAVTKQSSGPDEVSAGWALAVLPARPLTIELLSERDRNLGLAISDTLIDRLGAIPQFVLRPTRAVRTYAGDAADPTIVGRSLRADAVIDTMFIRTGEPAPPWVSLVGRAPSEFLRERPIRFEARIRRSDSQELRDQLGQRLYAAGQNFPIPSHNVGSTVGREVGTGYVQRRYRYMRRVFSALRGRTSV